MNAAGPSEQIHVQSLRLASGSEALVARVVARDGVAGFGFTLGPEAYVARELAAWDARARRASVPLFRLLGAGEARSVAFRSDPQPPFAPDWHALEQALAERRLPRLSFDLWAWGGIAPAQRAATLAEQAGIEISFVAPHAHPWEIAVCAALAAACSGSACVAFAAGDPAPIAVPQAPGLGVGWEIEAGFAALEW